MIHRDNSIEQPELNIYPLTIVCDRYGGAYSNARYTAWNEYVEDVPRAIDANDIDCATFWTETDHIVGKGCTPDEALEDLYEQLQKSKK